MVKKSLWLGCRPSTEHYYIESKEVHAKPERKEPKGLQAIYVTMLSRLPIFIHGRRDRERDWDPTPNFWHKYNRPPPGYAHPAHLAASLYEISFFYSSFQNMFQFHVSKS
jgi:hypothetical protein